MSEVVLITGSETLTGRKLIEKQMARGAHVVAPITGKETETNETGNKSLSVLTWNRASWFSTKAVIREALRIHGRIDAAFLLHLPPASRMSFADSESGDIEDIIEQSIKGTVALARELHSVLNSSGGFLGMVFPHRAGADNNPLSALAAGAFAGFSNALIAETFPTLWACGFRSTSPDADGFADELIHCAAQRPKKLRGRWFQYAEGRRPFGGSTITDSIN